jgi:hypothetical protein
MFEKNKIKEILHYLFLNRIFFSVLYALIFIILFWLVARFAVNVPYWDQWDFAQYLIGFYEKKLSLPEFLFIQHNEARLVFPFLIEIILGYFSNYNVIWEIYFEIFLLIFISLILFYVFMKEFKEVRFNYFYFIPILLLLVTFRQYSNYLWGFQINYYLCILAVLASIYLLLQYDRPGGYVFALSMATIGIFSFLLGLLLIPIGALILVQRHRKKPELLGWIIFSITVLAIYFWNWTKPGHIQSVMNFNSAADLTSYILVNVGSPLADTVISAAASGFIVLILSLIVLFYIYKRNLIKENYFWIYIMIFSFACSLVNGIGRTNWGISNAFVSRYTPFAIIGIISLYCLILALFVAPTTVGKRKNWYSFLLGSIAILLALGLISGNIQGFQEFSSRNVLGVPKTDLLYDQYYLLTYQYQPDEYLTFLPPLKVDASGQIPNLTYKNTIEKMEQRKLGIFKEQMSLDGYPVLDLSTPSHIERINGVSVTEGSTFTIHRNDSIVEVSGWAADIQNNAPAQRVSLSIDDTIDIPLLYSIKRTDVSDYFKNKDFEYTGFWGSFSPGILDTGTHTLTLKILAHNGEGVYLTEPVQIYVTDKISTNCSGVNNGDALLNAN